MFLDNGGLRRLLNDVGRRVYHDKIGGKPASGFAFG
jgi:hypothetical protein